MTHSEARPLLSLQEPHHESSWFGIPRRIQGMLLVALSVFTFSILSALVKYTTYSMPSMETVFWRSSVACLLNLVAMQVYGISLKVEREFWVPLATRCIGGCCGLVFGFYAMQQMVLADASVLWLTSSVMTFFLGAVFLNERVDAINLGSAFLSFIGVICVCRPTFIFGSSTDAQPPLLGVLSAFMAAAGEATAFTSMRRLKELHFMVTIHYFLVTGTVVSSLWLISKPSTIVIYMSVSLWLAVLGIGVCGFIGQLFLTRGFQLEKAGTASVMRYLDVVFIFIWDTVFLHETIIQNHQQERHTPHGRRQRPTPSKEALHIMADLVYKEIEVMATELQHFAHHANRKVIKPEDVVLLARKDPNLTRMLQRYQREQLPSSTVTKKRRRHGDERE
ncbi:hypothetical protein Poli38472_002532 [Pythium oligandrum]|uniref:EamA domain-containing protein n=1 Tax=Pythium oligandrum TaxID=41045 RepID=A0A8K1CHD8_PYTOL|nr:hypothetical protein Poli38472_002532 [Pythium oligandrum]|eukprot:TMW63591.1 hypothetical protein Poli38472_002532 [Pythium oligandrum]